MAGAVTRWDPFSELADLRSRLLDDSGARDPRTPAIDVVRNEHDIAVHADIPGFKPDEVKIEVADDVLTIAGEHEETEEEKNQQYVRRERRFGSFSRSLALPAGVDPSTIEAKTHDGVVEVTIPLPEEAKREPVTITPTEA